MVFDTLEQGSIAAMNGHGIAIADLHLTLDALKSGLLGLPFREALRRGWLLPRLAKKFTQERAFSIFWPGCKTIPRSFRRWISIIWNTMTVGFINTVMNKICLPSFITFWQSAVQAEYLIQNIKCWRVFCCSASMIAARNSVAADEIL